MKLPFTLKHLRSRLPDLTVTVEVDHLKHLVTVEAAAIDSALLLDLVTRLLPDHDIVAWSDDSVGWQPLFPTYALRLRVADRCHAAQVTKLLDGSFTLRIEPSAAAT